MKTLKTVGELKTDINKLRVEVILDEKINQSPLETMVLE